jgi:hypothetical protein
MREIGEIESAYQAAMAEVENLGETADCIEDFSTRPISAHV